MLSRLCAAVAAAIFVGAWLAYAFDLELDSDLVGVEYALFLGGLPVAVGVVVGRWPGVLLALSVLAVPASSGHCETVAAESDFVVTWCGGGLAWWELTMLMAVTALELAAGIGARRVVAAYAA
jgi:hypothetical protein